MNVVTGTSSKTVVVVDDGYYTVEPPPLCSGCKEQMHPMMWLCGRCGEVA